VVDQARATDCDRDRAATACTTVRGGAILVLSFFSLSVFAAAAQAQTNLIQNGTFSQAVIGGTTQAAEAAEFGSKNNGFTPSQTLVGWTTAGYNFVFLPGTADTTGATGQATVKLWGPANNGTNAALLPQSSPTGGNYIAADGAYEISAITQTINGLTAGQTYAVSFAWAGAQQYSFSGPTSDEWTVSLGTVSATNPSQTTSLLSLPTEGASGWMDQTFDFVATSSSEVLSFLATGTPSGQPPFALLANVSMTQVPEPSTWALMLTGLVGLIGIVRMRGGPGSAIRGTV
jgi:hypothetical protein